MESKVIKYSEKVLGTKKITEEAIKGIAELSIPNNNYCDFIFLSEVTCLKMLIHSIS